MPRRRQANAYSTIDQLNSPQRRRSDAQYSGPQQRPHGSGHDLAQHQEPFDFGSFDFDSVDFGDFDFDSFESDRVDCTEFDSLDVAPYRPQVRAADHFVERERWPQDHRPSPRIRSPHACIIRGDESEDPWNQRYSNLASIRPRLVSPKHAQILQSLEPPVYDSIGTTRYHRELQLEDFVGPLSSSDPTWSSETRRDDDNVEYSPGHGTSSMIPKHPLYSSPDAPGQTNWQRLSGQHMPTMPYGMPALYSDIMPAHAPSYISPSSSHAIPHNNASTVAAFSDLSPTSSSHNTGRVKQGLRPVLENMRPSYLDIASGAMTASPFDNKSTYPQHQVGSQYTTSTSVSQDSSLASYNNQTPMNQPNPAAPITRSRSSTLSRSSSSGTRPTCAICLQPFSRHSDMIRHQWVHSDYTLWCTLCKKTGSRPGKLVLCEKQHPERMTLVLKRTALNTHHYG